MAVAALAARQFVLSQEGTGIVDFTKLTPIPFPGYPTGVSEGYNDPWPTCQAPADEQPDPDLPPLSCRNSASEPPPGSIKTPAPAEIPDATAVAAEAPKEWTVIDNRLFRYTLAIPPGWYSNMRPEGGEFRIFDETHTKRIMSKGATPGGIAGSFSARPLARRLAGFPIDVEDHLASPNTSFGIVPGAIWDDGTR